MSVSRLRIPLTWLLAASLLAILGHVTAQTNPCQQQLCVNGGICRRAYLQPGYICECTGDWQGQNCEQRFPGTSPAMPKQCGVNSYGESGTITSPNYPQLEPHNQNCYYLVRIPSALSISFQFRAFSSEPFKDELYIIPGTLVDTNSPSVRIYNGTLPADLPVQVFQTNQLVLYWLTDHNVQSPGFSIDYSIDPDPCWVNPCQNGGACTTIGRDYSCTCLPDFTGNDCQTGTVIVSQTSISISVGNTLSEGRISHTLTFDLTFTPGQTLFSLTGTGLWSVTLFLTDGGTNRVASQVVPLSSQQSNVAWSPPSSSIIRTIQTTVNLNALSCPQMRSVCAMIGQGSNPAPPFLMRGTPNENALIGCTQVQCRGVEATSVTFGGTLNDLREGVSSQALSFDMTMSTNPQAGSVSGSNLWKITLYGSTQANGLGTQVLRTQLTLNPSQAGASTDLSGNVQFFSLQTALSLVGLVCSQVRYICVTIEKSENPTPQFTLTGMPSDAVLTACQATTCNGVQVTSTSISITSGTPVIERRSNTLAFSLSIQTNSDGGSVSGQNLFSIQTFGSNSLTGTSVRISERRIQGSTGITAGRLATIPNLSTTMDLSGRLCQDIVALCTELAKNAQANPDFTLDPIPNSGVLQECINIECRGVFIQTMDVVVTSGVPVLYGNRNQMLTFNLRVQANTPSASISGFNLWRLIVYANNRLDGSGPRIGQVQVTLSSAQQNTAISAGQAVNLNNLDLTMDLSSVTSCADIAYLCVELQKSSNPSPAFTLQGSTTRCIQVQCAMFNPCGSNPCQNGGACSNVGSAFTCSCANGWTGPLCQQAVNACNGIVCRNGGVCIDSQFSYVCRCTLGWQGQFCELVDNGIQITTTTLSLTSGTIRENTAQNRLTLSVVLTNSQSGSTLPTGSGYWQVNFFTSLQANGQGQRFNQQSLNLDALQSGLGITSGGVLTLSGVQSILNLQGQSCSSVPYVCVEIQKGNNPSPDFLLSGSLIACQETNCIGVQVIQVTGSITSGQTLLIGQNSHTINMNIIVRASSNGASISGSNLWTAQVFTNTLQSGAGTTVLQQNAVLSNQAVSLDLIAGGSITLSGATVTFDLSTVTSCQQVSFLCVRLGKNPLASPDFTLTGVPDNFILTHCQTALCQVPSPCDSHNCQNGAVCQVTGTSYICVCANGWGGDRCTQGVQIVNINLRVVSTNDVRERNTNNPLTLDLTITTNPNGGSVSGTRLWRLTAFLSTQPDGSGPEYSTTTIQLSDAQASTGLQAGVTATISSLQTNANTAQSNLMCGQFGYICVRLERGPNPSVNFQLGDGSQSYVACAPANCRGVEITDVVATIVSGEPVNTETTSNNLVFNVQVSSSPSGASVSGSNLWQVIVFSDTQLNGQGQTVIQAQATLPGNTASTFLQAGVDMVLRSVQVNLDLTQISCNQIPYICVRFLKATNPGPNPDYTFTAVPSDDVLLHCQALDCMDPSSCIGHLCENGGQCMDLGSGSYRCLCTPGWTGLYCSVVADYCLTTQTPCFNGGQCINLADRYQCNCQQDWVGPRCRIDNPCLPTNPCINGGTCFSDQSGIYTCNCPPGYSGNNCQITPDPCISDLCQNGARCERIGTGSDYQCFCQNGFAGRYCNITLDPCDSSPCFNGGTCSRVGTLYVYQCQCPNEYTGTNCQTLRDPCATNPCLNGGICSRQGSTNFVCQCSLGYTGTTCNIRQDPCASNPCRNNGVCSRVGTSFVYQCQCVQGYTGTNCEIPNACVSNPCQNGGQCSQQGAGYQCQCQPGWGGPTCNIRQNPCASNPCQNNGGCLWGGTSFVYQCQCLQGYTGTNCEIPNACVSNPCQNGGQCNQLGAGYQCQCQPGWGGPTCNIRQNPCASNPCLNNGGCLWGGTIFVYQCQCVQGYTGTNCEIPNACVSNPCQNGGQCNQLGAGYQCQCQPGWGGPTCNIRQNACVSNPCQNGGQCNQLGAGYQCQCQPGWSGPTCTIILNPCVSTPCLNGATCSQSGTDFTCQCAAGYTGTNCGVIQNPCNNNPCQNGGFCSWQGQVLIYQCQCQTGYGGNNCQIITNPCVNTPCLNGATCSQSGSDFTCQCAAGYTGTNCGVVQNPCNNNPCQNGGVCSWQGQALVYQCQCQPGYSGNNCQIITNPCVNTPCLNGATCSQSGSDFTCQCAAGYTGTNCGVIQNPCNNNPCQNGGFCSWQGQALVYQCQCLPGYSGNNCQIITNPCDNNPCQNGGFCSWQGQALIYQCQCQPGYSGNNCQIVTNPCDNNPCQNGGFCSWQGQALIYQCQCLPGYGGNNCQIITNPCVNTPCLNGATCSQSGTDFTCQCAAGYTGTNCGVVQNPCTLSPCQNGGTCQWFGQVSTYQCLCLQGYNGNNCQIIQDPCNSNPCLNNGLCQWPGTSFTYSCQCTLGYTGVNCGTAQNPCDSNPCVNGGACSWQIPNYRYVCQCPSTHTGINCQTPLGSCFSSPCQNGGTCFNLDQGVGYFCSCFSNYKGPNCQYPDPCSSFPCQNSGACSSNQVGSIYTCSCLANFQGINCQYPNPCSSQPCQNSGVCVPNSLGSSYTCNCNPGFIGVHCQFSNPCFSNPCFNNGQCATDNIGSRYTCNCLAGYVGDHCQLNDPCLPNPCQNGAICSLANGGLSYECSCLNGFFGTNCQIPDPCNTRPCLNDGTCTAINGGLNFACICQQQYMGNTCQYPNPCYSFPCQNSGTCEPHPLGTSYTCVCPPDFQGQRCENRNPCSSNPCLNNGACQVGIGGTSFFCNCPSQFLGPRCQNLDPCLSTPCLNGGVCTYQAQGLLYSCTCPPHYFGMNCEILDACSSNPCLNGGICNPSSFGFTCTCAPGYTGTTCTISEPCGRLPCLNGGTCYDSTGPTGFFCRCTSSFIGDTCQIPDLCSFSPCLNGGTCSNIPAANDFRCACPFGHSGKRCEMFNPCSSNPCQNGGTCNRDSLGTIYNCNCVVGYDGTNCEFGPGCFSSTYFHCVSGECVPSSRQCDQSFDCQDGSDEASCQRQCTNQEFRCTGGTCINIQLVCNGINDCTDGLDEQNCPSACDSSPCLNGGVCENAGTIYICTCAQGWTGTTCSQVVSSSNDPPSFVNQVISIEIREDTVAGTTLVELRATDPDSDTLTFGLYDFTAQQLFVIVPNPNDPKSAFLTLKGSLDREVQSDYTFVVSVTDDGGNEVIHSGTLLLSDVNDNAPTFTNLPNVTTVYENANVGFQVFYVDATDPDLSLSGLVTYTITEGMDAPFFINLYNGIVHVTGPLDYETDQVYNLAITASDNKVPFHEDQGTNSLSTTMRLTIQVLDVQDTGPIFIDTPYDRTINEGTPLNTVVVTVTAVDQDTVNANNITYTILAGNMGNYFSLDETTGQLTLVREVDSENLNTPSSVNIIVRAIETGTNGGTSAVNNFTITINDIDDEPPLFNQSTYSVSVSEAENPGFVLPVGIQVSDGEITIQGNFRITLQNSNIVPFSVSPSSAVDQTRVTVTLIRPLDYETTKSYDLVINAQDTATSTATVVVTVTDANDNDPIFTHGTQTIALEEGAPMNTMVTTVTVTDADEGINEETEFSIIGGNQEGLFTINPTTGVVTTTSVIDYENSARTYTLTVQARNTQPAVSPADGVSEVTVVVTITDINDSPPVFQQPNYLIQIIEFVLELSDTGLTIGRVIADDADSGAAGEVTYTILSGNDDGTFSVNPGNGNIVLLKPLDRETVPIYNITIRAQDNAAPPLSATTYVVIEVRDFNDNDPQWVTNQYAASVVEGQPADTFVIQVMATDADIGLNALLRYELAVPSQYLYINQTSGQIYTRVPLDREQTETIVVNVLARDSGNPSRSSAQLAVVTVTVLDINDTPPTFTGAPFRFEVAENEPAGTFVGEVTANDPDTIGTLVYTFTSPQTQFLIDQASGRITTINSLNREQQDRYEVEVQVTDGTFEATADVVIVVTDVNDNQPMFSQAIYPVTVVENTPAGIILNLMANDTDIGLNSAIIYQFDQSGNTPIGPFFLDRVTGALRTTSPLDRETQDSYTLVVNAIDREGGTGSLQAVATVLVTVTDVNDNRPVFDFQNYADTVPEDAAEGQEIIQVGATDRDIGDNAVILYRIIQGNNDNNFQIDATNGIISRGPTPLDRETKDSYVLTVEAYNDGDLPPRNTAAVTITVTDVNDEVPHFTQDVYLKPDLLENADARTVVATVSANDPDLGQGGQILYSITGGNDGNHFIIDSVTGVIRVLGSLPDYSIKSTYNLTVTARDQAQPFHTSQARVMVLLVDAQDDPPEFTMTRYEVNLTENVGEGFPFLQVMAQVPGKPNSIVTYSLDSNVNPSILQLFDVDPITGWLTTKGTIDYETGLPLYTFTVLGVNDGTLPGSAAVWVYIQDVNDNAPVFVNYPTSAVTVDENKAGGFVVATVSANDVDSGLNGNVVYEITGGNDEGHFDIIANNGEALIVTTTELDRETIESYMLTITASDQGVPVMNSSIFIDVVVNDLNDNPPGFNQTSYNATVEENVLLNRPITTVLITDLDTPASNNIVFQIDPASNPNGIFQINSQGEITITSQLDRELQAFYDLIVVMTDPTYNPSFMETTHVYVTVLDQNDNPPIFPDQPPVSVTEGPSSMGEIFVTVTANDADVGNNSEMVYTITGGNGEGIFGIHSNNGSIYVINELDWETTQRYELIVTATDQAMNSNDRRSGTVTVVIDVEDINDTPPQFPSDYFGPYSFSEGVPGTYIGTFVAVDSDSGAGGEVTYTIIGEYSDLFVIDPTTGVLTLKPTAQLDYETSQAFNITIVATDAGVPSLNGTTSVGIIVVSINDNSPKFQDTPYRTGINDTTPVDTWVYKVVATDDDSGPEGNITYSILNGNTGGVFRIDPLTGDVYVNKTLTNGVYVLVIKARDNPENPANAREVTETLTILVADSTSIVPIFPDDGTFTGSVQEHSTVGTFVMTISVENAADVGDLIYTISGPDAGPFLIDPSTGIITVNGLLDAEIQDLHVFDVSALDSRGMSASGKVYVTILNINDHPPQLDELVFNFTVPEDAGDGYFVGHVNATDDDNSDTMLRFTIERGAQDKFTIDPTTGVITVLVTCRGDICDQQPLDREEQDVYTLTVSVSDQGSPPLSNSGVVYIYVTDVNDYQPTFPADFLNAVVSVSEDVALNHTVITLEATDMDLDAMLTYRIVSITATNLQGEPLTNISAIESWFAVDPYTGVVYVENSLDRETAAEVILKISANDSASLDPALSTSNPNAMVTIQITDVNDNAPVYQPPGTTYIYVTIQEESSMGTIITNVRAIDPDNPINGEVTYMLIGNLSEYVTIHPVTGQITVNQIIDRELYDWLNFTIIATDDGTPSLSTPIPIMIQILDINDHNPIFDQPDYTATVPENSDGVTYVTVVTATDQDLGQYGEVTYTLTGGEGLFTINSTTGVITALQPLDQEEQSVYTLTVIAVDNPGGSQTNRRQGSATVTITVGNVNEYPPITQPNFPFDIPEGQPGGTLVGVIDATDPDDPMQELNFTFIFVEPPDGDVLFYINQTTGEIFTTMPLDADNATYGNTFNITILISDNGNPPLTTTTTTIITIQDTNDNDPLFPNGPYDLTTSEATPVGNQVTVVIAEDIDQNAVLTYSIVDGNLNGTFFINPTNGEILITKPLDFETRTMYNLTVQVSDQDGRTGTTYVVIRIMDANDQGPVFLSQPYLFDVNENVDIGTEIGLIEAVDADPDPSNSQLTYHILSSVPANAPFAINETTGVITSSGALDRELQDSYMLTVEVRNVRFVPGGEDVTYKLSTPVTITILDLNDNIPIFSGGDNITRTFPENSEINFPIYQPSAQDNDIGENGRVTYSIVSGNVENTFSIDPQTGAILLARQIQTLTNPTYAFTLVVEARDNGDPSLYSNITINAVVGDYNDNAPQFVTPIQGQTLFLPENEPIGFQIAPVLAVDIDSGANGQVTYGFHNEESARLFYFQQEGDTTYLYANFSADRETKDQYNLVLLATDGGTPNPLQTPLEVTVVILDKQDNEPFFVRVDNVAIVQQLNVTEHSNVNVSVGIVTLAQDHDLPPNDVIYYYIVGGNDKGLFGINSTTGEIIILGDLDRETIATHNLLIKATNNASYVPSGIYDISKDVSLKEVLITVGDINDNGPKFTTVLYTAGIPLDAEINTQVTCIKATDLDLGGGGAITYGIQSATFVLGQDQTASNDIFYIDENSGCIRTRNLLNGITAGGYFDLTVTATDKIAGLGDTALVRIFVLDNNQQVVVVVDSDIDTVTQLQDQLVQIISNITGGVVNVDSITYYIDANGNTVRDKTMIVLHVIDPETNSLVDANIVLRLIDENRMSIQVLLQRYGVVDVYALMGGVGGAGFGIIEIALLAIALLLFLGALIFIIILCCLQRKLLKKIHGNSPAVIYATRADADVKETATYQGSNPLWLETEGGLPDDWPDSISLLGGGAAREYESQEASMDFFSDIQPEIARDALVMTAMVSDGQSASTRSKTISNGGVSSGRVGSDKAQLRTVSSTGPLILDSANMDGSVSTLTNRINRDGSVSANLTGQEGGYSASGAAYSYSSASFSGGPSTSKKLTSEKAHEIRQMLEEDQGVETYLEDDMYRDQNTLAAARASYREQVEFDNQLSPITEEDTASSWSSWTRDSERSGARYAALGSLDRNRTTDRPSKDYADPMNNFTTSTSIEESYSRSVKSPSKTESSSYSRRANSKTYPAGVSTSIGMVTLTEETPDMIDDEESETSSVGGAGKTYTYNIMGDSSEGAHSMSGGSSGHSAPKRATETSTMNFSHEGDDTDEVIEEREVRRSMKTTRGYTNSGYDNFMDEESRL
ncbi:uncharacterized protein LOC119731947 isoform X4 [Patiria miniata]|uniref:Uncharacterized protein n=1 Tax=Patiria miniata TaxID=46514 RepID=A0A914ABS2_PATMI|nr:uncharacterized protein LOC119731947 isoform X4 [Patiria miniata]